MIEQTQKYVTGGWSRESAD